MKTGFIGLGVQGKYLALNQVAAGYDLMAFDLRAEPLEELAAVGAKIAKSAKDVAAYAEVIQVCVLDDIQLGAVMRGPEGVFAGCAKGTIICIHSTVRPATIAELAEEAASLGVEVMDVPVSGSETGAKAKTMSYMVGGSEAGFAKCKPLFETSGPKVLHTGALGTGIRAKLGHQLVICINILAAYEGGILAEASGLDPEVLRAVLRDGAGQSRIAERWKKIAFGPTSQRVFYKDLQLCIEYGHELGISLPGAALTAQMIDTMLSWSKSEAR
jgi:2-hydroxy-3-oxopropionate reductase